MTAAEIRVRVILAELEQRGLVGLVDDEARRGHVSVDELLGPGHEPLAVHARHAVWRRLFDDPEVHWSINRIAKLFRVDRSTVSYALHRRDRRRAA